MSSLRLSALDSSLEVHFAAPAGQPMFQAAVAAWSRCLPEQPTSVEAEPLDATLPADGSEEALHHAMQMLTQVITRRLIDAQSGRLWMLHAGAVSHPVTGNSLVFVAPGGTGKTTLARVLGRRYGYLTDETVGFDSTGRIHPYPKPLSLRQKHGGAKLEASPDELGLGHAHPDPTVTRVILLRRP
ncbi:MAG TPA: hypothetical protein VLR88_03885, partial [Propionibacteriaceae bacterium]|nr:hypothetical protein [Propionibacteriaceae bacterium]